MKRKMIFSPVLGLLFLPFILAAQLTPEQRIADSVIGWWNNNRFDNHLKPSNDPLYKKRVEILDKIAEWMKKSYTPVGGLGTVSRENYQYAYGVRFLVWNVSFKKEWLDAGGHFRPIPEENTPFGIHINNIPSSYPVEYMNTPTQYYFTWPPDGYGSEDRKNADPRIHPNVYKYITRQNSSQIVLLAPNNKLPFTEVTRGEYLDEAEASFDRELQKQKEIIKGQWPGDNERDAKSREEALAYRLKDIDRYRDAIHKWREKYRDHLQEPAVVRNMQPTLHNDFYGDTDPFYISGNEKAAHQYYPVYKMSAALLAKCKSDQPQWIAIWFPYKTKEDGNQLYEMFTAVSQNLNYDYIYNYFFDPEKVKGKTYLPANEDQLKARLEGFRKRTAAANAVTADNTSLTGNIFFADNFNNSPDGGEPANWFFRKTGKHSAITPVKNQSGKWLQLGYNNNVSPVLLKKPLPDNFTLEYDLVTDGGFSTRTGGAATLILNSRPAREDGAEMVYDKGSRVVIDVESGNEADYNNNNYRGILRIAVNSTPSENNQNNSEGIFYEYELREFTNGKTKIHVAVKVQGGLLSVFVNDKQVATSKNFKLRYDGACITCGLPAGTRINSIFWNNKTSDADNIHVYLSNIKITRE